MTFLKNIIKRCHQRHEKPLHQKKTIVSPAIYKGLFYHFTVFCARRHPVRLHDLEQADISFMPIGRTPYHDRVPQSFGGKRFQTRQTRIDWDIRQWHTSWGLHIYTGVPSEHNNAQWHDLHFSYQAICDAPDAVLSCIKTLANSVVNPLLTLTKSGGLRFSCRVLNYLHPNTETERFYIYKDTQVSDNRYRRDVYLEVLGDSGHSAWDARYEIIAGDLLNPPILLKEILFTAINPIREELHAPDIAAVETLEPYSEPIPPPLSTLGSQKLDLAKEAFLKRGFTYIKQEQERHYWKQLAGQNDGEVLLWEQNGNVWIRASTPSIGLPMENTLITALWDDTGILPPILDTEPPISQEIQAVREGKLSPLAIKRPAPVLEKTDQTEKIYESFDKNIEKLQRVLNSDARSIGLIAETHSRNNFQLEEHILNETPASIICNFTMTETMAKHFQKQGNISFSRWRNVTYLWQDVNDIPVDVRMANPFQHGNICEDPERFLALARRGVNATETLCPQCPVYIECQARGYLSQPDTLQQAKTQMYGFERTFLDQNNFFPSETLLTPYNGTERLCIIDDIRIYNLFLPCSIPKNILETWCTIWQGKELGHFAQALLNALAVKQDTDEYMLTPIRTVMQAFQQHEAEIIKQMCQVLTRGKIIEQDFIDEQTGVVLAQWTIIFEGGATVYIPRDNCAAETLKAKGIPVVQLDSPEVNTDITIPMPIEKAIQLGIYDITTVKQIETFPGVYQNPGWTLWHQLKCFLSYYRRDVDAPIVLHQNVLEFFVPPMISPNIKRLLLISSTHSQKDFLRTLPDEDIEVFRLNPIPWVEGNIVLQIRTGDYSLKTLLDYNSNWDVVGLTKSAERILLAICAEIEKNPNVKHAIITYTNIIKQLEDVAKKDNVCLVTEFKERKNLETEFEAADVVWIIGTPYWDPAVIWLYAQIMYGNDEKPLCYDADANFQYYKDKRLQQIYKQTVTELISDIVGRIGLNRLANKKVVLMSSFEIPDITDRPETLLFDWEDFEIAGSLDKLVETITTRNKFETERDNLTSETSRREVERVLGCSTRTANRVLQKLRGGNIPHVTYREQILTLLNSGEKKVAELTAAIEGNPKGIHNELMRLTELGEIIKVRRGVYALPK